MNAILRNELQTINAERVNIQSHRLSATRTLGPARLGESERFDDVDLTSEELKNISQIIGVIYIGAATNLTWFEEHAAGTVVELRTTAEFVADMQELHQIVARLRPLTLDQ